MAQEEAVLQCVALLRAGVACDRLAALLCLTAMAERCLGELVLMCGGQVPFLLRDLLDTPELLGVMGATWVKVAKVLVGSVLGLNMRNLAWHGFLNPEETQAGPVCALLLLLAECGRVLEEQGGNEAVPRKPSMCLSLKEGVGVEVEEGEVWPSRAVVEEVVETSGLVPLVMKPVWRRALDHLLEGRHWVGLVLLLPQLECSLRCLFAWANEVPSRVLTAQHTALYTTLDHALAAHVTGGGAGGAEGGGGGGVQIEERREESGMIEGTRKDAPDDNYKRRGKREDELKPEQETKDWYQPSPPSPITTTAATTITKEEGNRDGEYNKEEEHKGDEYNKVLPILGREITEALFDFLNFSQGPRVRDRVSHGEADPGSVSPSAAIFALHLSLLILTRKNENHDNVIPRDSSGKCSGRNCCTNPEIAFESSNKGMETIKPPILPHPPLLSSTRLSQETENALQVLRKWISGYRSHYHPTSLLHAALLSSTSLLAGWKEWKRVERSEIDYVEWEKQVEVLVEEMDRLYERVEEEKGKSNVELEVGDRKGNKGRTDKEVDSENGVEKKGNEGSERTENKEENIYEREGKKTKEMTEYDEQIENGKERTDEVEKTEVQRTKKENTVIKLGVKRSLQEAKEERTEETERTHKQSEEEKTIKPKIRENLSYPSLSRTHTILPLTKTTELIAKIHNITFQVLHRPKSELEVVSVLRRITTNINASLRNTQDSLSFKHTQFREKKMRSRRRETYKRQLNAVPVVVWTCYLSLQAVYMVLLSLHDVPEMRRDSLSSLMRVLKGILKAMENLASQTDPQMNRWDEAVCLSRENVGFVLKHFG
ncbi:uncharacterized protein LOC135092743 isoform X2 [Scylla paramamosain]